MPTITSRHYIRGRRRRSSSNTDGAAVPSIWKTVRRKSVRTARACWVTIACGCRRKSVRTPETSGSASPRRAAAFRLTSWTVTICAPATFVRGGMPTSPRAKPAERLAVPLGRPMTGTFVGRGVPLSVAGIVSELAGATGRTALFLDGHTDLARRRDGAIHLIGDHVGLHFAFGNAH